MSYLLHTFIKVDVTLNDIFINNLVNYDSFILFYGFPEKEPLKTQSVLRMLPIGILCGKTIRIIKL